MCGVLMFMLLVGSASDLVGMILTYVHGVAKRSSRCMKHVNVAEIPMSTIAIFGTGCSADCGGSDSVRTEACAAAWGHKLCIHGWYGKL